MHRISWTRQYEEGAEYESQSGAAISLRFIGDKVAIFHGATRSARMARWKERTGEKRLNVVL